MDFLLHYWSVTKIQVVTYYLDIRFFGAMTSQMTFLKRQVVSQKVITKSDLGLNWFFIILVNGSILGLDIKD